MPQDVLITLRDGNNSTFPARARQLDDGTHAFYHAQVPNGISYVDKTIQSLTEAQSLGTASVIAANTERRMFAITPQSDGKLYIASSSGNGFYWPIYAGVTRVLSGTDCPTNALFVTGQAQSSTLAIAEG